MNKRVLIITFYFPPRPGIASLRLRGLAKYLPEFGWEPVILTAKLPGMAEPQYHVIETPYPGDVTSLWKRKLGLAPNMGFQEQLRVPRALRESRNSLTGKVVCYIKGLIAYPDEQKHWFSFAVNAGDNLLKSNHVDVLLSSFGPAICHLVAKELKRRHGIPWVADFRDLWTQNPYYQYGLLRKLFERRLEIRTLSAADALVTVSEPLAKNLRFLHSGKPVIVIPNGYDPDEVAVAPLTKEFTITYTGQLYQGKRDPTLLFCVIAELISEGHLDRRVVRVRFYGTMEYWLEKAVKRFGLEDVVSLSPQVSRNIALEKQRESQILLLLQWNDPREAGICPGKVFEYLAARRPILALGGVRGGVVAQLLEETGAGVHVSSEEDLRYLLVQWYNAYKAHGYVPYTGCEEVIAKYSHREMARRFASVLDACVKQQVKRRYGDG